ncbi:hypothetical protein DENSPDRAFT_842521 [Dentipellis sp. KUC8613]|nr:hypothetical protein DENSPDRAFT_842521 [Dentipellis sp. KUC8613]
MHFNLLAIAFGLLSLHAFAAPIANISSPDIPSSNITFAGNDTIDPDEIARFKGSKSFSM